jgi:hypothetical protein
MMEYVRVRHGRLLRSVKLRGLWRISNNKMNTTTFFVNGTIRCFLGFVGLEPPLVMVDEVSRNCVVEIGGEPLC